MSITILFVFMAVFAAITTWTFWLGATKRLPTPMVLITIMGMWGGVGWVLLGDTGISAEQYADIQNVLDSDEYRASPALRTVVTRALEGGNLTAAQAEKIKSFHSELKDQSTNIRHQGASKHGESRDPD